ncbi:hypothetical protein F0L68_30370 [Solihabitans fulvus]|uniref:DUF3592 domain-containing protein n=1 Tax=Solihabitans fulvus TaxID=1892852 RepID=A0A5B2WU01_9PSEU|nr:DUF3592 domain-containing protein [Solihabitans fulvus]KAA2254488.1 hypothetical protein F0L68_30370 [Solihabitans fulvus]
MTTGSVRQRGDFARDLVVAFVAAWVLVTAALVDLHMTSHPSAVAEQALYEHGIHSEAVVTETEPENRNTVHYEFHAAGQTYARVGSADPPNPLARELSVGNRIRIVYDSRDPNQSCACEPRKYSTELDVVGIVIRSTIVAIVVGPTVALVRRARRRRRSRAHRK